MGSTKHFYIHSLQILKPVPNDVVHKYGGQTEYLIILACLVGYNDKASFEYEAMDVFKNNVTLQIIREFLNVYFLQYFNLRHTFVSL